MNKFEKVFKKGMTCKEIAFTFFSLLDIYKNSPSEVKLLEEAFGKAFDEAQRKTKSIIIS